MGNESTGSTPSTRNPWLYFFGPNPEADVRLFCLPYAGGTVTTYRAWPKKLPRNVEVGSVQLPGRGSRMPEPPFTQLAPLVRALAQNLLPYLDRPFALFGHSMGALVAFELARHLRREHGLTPAHFFSSGQSAPQYDDGFPPLHELPEAELLEELRRLNGTPREALEHPELIKLMLPVLRADFAVFGNYEYAEEAPLGCPITVFGGLEDPQFPREGLEAWREQAGSSLSLHMLPGDHFFLRTSETQLLNILAEELQQTVDSLRAAA